MRWSRRIRWAEYVLGRGEVHLGFDKEIRKKETTERPRCGWGDYIKIVL
jgi:hypothetical protein